MSLKKVRVRFAPSPTGPLHMGGVRTALYNYLFAKKNNGTFILRIEDTDQNRFVEGAQDYILNSFKWCGITPDEGPGIGGEYGPYVQSERKEMYQEYAQRLIESEHAYYAFDTSEELTQMRDEAKKMGMPNWQYNGVSRVNMRNSLTLPQSEVEKLIENKEPYVIRMKMPRNEDVRFEDEIRGWVVVNTNNLDDKVLYKSDGMPTYHLANIVDDHAMEISHVIRGEEWLPSAPLHVLLYDAFSWERPQFAHLPLLLKPDGNGKLSKRDGDRLGFPVFPLDWTTSDGELYSGYKEKGYFPEAFINMLAFLGWNPGTQQELFNLEELSEAFGLDRVSKGGAKFDPEKTKWFQQQYIRSASNEKLAELLVDKFPSELTTEQKVSICSLMKERATFAEDIVKDGAYLYQKPTSYDEKVLSKKWKENTASLIEQWMDILKEIESFTSANIEADFKAFLEKNQLGFGAVLLPFRILVTGVGAGPGMFDISEFLGKEEVLERIEKGLVQIEHIKNEA
ncbi:MAG: glutamate--tRNA ligase [Crocinitomicaceae bacterium]|tara:strand:- start:1813 stop:3342 length:1530 start_codon:yes stop_codon:yes gene_type:complete